VQFLTRAEKRTSLLVLPLATAFPKANVQKHFNIRIV